MSDANPEEPQFVEDGHTVRIVWDKDDIKVGNVYCPNDGSMAMCNRRRGYCVVKQYLDVYGFDLNVGRTVVKNPVEIAWVGVIGESDIDAEFAQVWVIPVDDPEYVTWKEFGTDTIPDDEPGELE